MKITHEIKKILFQNIFIPVVMGFLSCVIIGITFYHNHYENLAAHQNEEIIRNVTMLQKLLSDGQAGARGYLLSGNAFYLEPYNTAKAKVKINSQNLIHLVRDNELQLKRAQEAEALILDWFNFIQQNLKGTNGYYRKSMSPIISGVGERKTIDLRKRLQEIADEEYSLRKMRAEEIDWFFPFSVAFLIPFLILGNTFIAYCGRKSIVTIASSYDLIIEENKYQLSLLEKENWLQETEARLSTALVKADTIEGLCQQSLGFILENFGALAGTVFIRADVAGDRYIRKATIGVAFKNNSIHDLAQESTLYSKVLLSKKAVVLDNFAESRWELQSGLGIHVPKYILLAPILFSNTCIAIVELAFNNRPHDRLLEFFEGSSERLGGLFFNEISKDELERRAILLRNSQQKMEDNNTQLQAANDLLQRQALSLEEQKEHLDQRNQELLNTQNLLRQQAQDLQKTSQYKSQFLAHMSHEIRTPITALIGFSELLSPMVKDRATANEYVDVILKNGKNLLDLLNEILDLSKVEAGQLDLTKSDINILTVIDEVLELLGLQAEKSQVKLIFEPESREGLYCHADPLRLKQIITNIVGNAIKFTKAGGSVMLSLDVSEKKNKLVLQVADTGVGIDVLDVEQLFKPFSQLGHAPIHHLERGTGLGLSLSKKLAQNMDGNIYLMSSTLGKGSTFAIEIPLADVNEKREEIATKDEAPEYHENSLTPVKILLADDCADNRMLIETVLGQYGANIKSVENGQEAVDKFNEYNPHVVLMDLKMPILDGISATKALRANGHTQPIIILTANAMKGERDAALLAGATDYVSKPINWKKLLNAIQLATNAQSH